MVLRKDVATYCRVVVTKSRASVTRRHVLSCWESSDKPQISGTDPHTKHVFCTSIAMIWSRKKLRANLLVKSNLRRSNEEGLCIQPFSQAGHGMTCLFSGGTLINMAVHRWPSGLCWNGPKQPGCVAVFGWEGDPRFFLGAEDWGPKQTWFFLQDDLLLATPRTLTF